MTDASGVDVSLMTRETKVEQRVVNVSTDVFSEKHPVQLFMAFYWSDGALKVEIGVKK